MPIMKSWKEFNQSLEEKKLDPVGKEDGDVDNDGDEDSSDEYLMKRRKAIGKAMGKKMKKEQYEVSIADKKGNTPAYQNYKKGMKNKLTGKPMYKAGKGVEESVKFSEAELKAIEEKVNSWED